MATQFRSGADEPKACPEPVLSSSALNLKAGRSYFLRRNFGSVVRRKRSDRGGGRRRGLSVPSAADVLGRCALAPAELCCAQRNCPLRTLMSLRSRRFSAFNSIARCFARCCASHACSRCKDACSASTVSIGNFLLLFCVLETRFGIRKRLSCGRRAYGNDFSHCTMRVVPDAPDDDDAIGSV